MSDRPASHCKPATTNNEKNTILVVSRLVIGTELVLGTVRIPKILCSNKPNTRSYPSAHHDIHSVITGWLSQML